MSQDQADRICQNERLYILDPDALTRINPAWRTVIYIDGTEWNDERKPCLAFLGQFQPAAIDRKDVGMFKPLKLLTAASLLMALAAAANAAPISAIGQSADVRGNSAGNLIEVHGGHHACRYGVRGWHRHVWRRGERVRIPCRSYRRDHRHRYDDDACIIIGDFIKICPDD